MHSSRIAVMALVSLPLTFARGGEAGPRMRAPITYVIDYARRYLDDDQHIEAMRGAPPGLMHVGKSVPILHNWGPVPLISGENQYTGGPGHTLKWEAIRLLTPQELAQRIQRLERYTKKWHDVGVTRLMPYSSFHTIAGDHEKREGFWKFYDHWSDYEKWLGPKPNEDPFHWLMVDRRGKFVPGACGGYAPKYYAPLHRYRVCPEHPEWQKFQIRLAELIAEAGYDGVFPDNSSVANVCFCKYCQAGLKRFAQGLSPRQLKILGVTDDPADVDLVAEDAPKGLVRRYRIDTVCRYQRMVRDAGRKVSPKFEVFPNVNSYRTFMPISFSCDYLMFESTYSPGCNFTGEPPEEPFVTVEVVDKPVDVSEDTFELSAQNGDTFVELSAALMFPKRIRVGEVAKLTAQIRTLGASNTDGDWAEGFAFVLSDMTSGQEHRVPLKPGLAVGGGGLRPRAKRPPVDLSASWRPAKVGRYKLHFAYEYTDEQHLDVTKKLPCRHALNLGHIYQTHIGQLLFTMHAGARTVLLDYECMRKGKEAVQELGLAECAAFSSGSTIASRGEPRRKYAKFFRRAKHLYEGFEPYADIGLLYSYWGYNPGRLGLRPSQELSPSVVLSARQRPIKVLMDRTIAEGDLATLKTLILCGHALELTDDQLATIRAFVRNGGKLYVHRPDTTINAVPFGESLDNPTPWEPGLAVPGMRPLSTSGGYARGLRFSIFTKRIPRRMTLHAVNYNVSHRTRPAVVTEVRDATIAVDLPPGWEADTITAWDPDRPDSRSLRFEQAGSQLVVSIPEARIYQVIELSAK